MTSYKITAILAAIALSLGVVAIGVVDNIIGDGPERQTVTEAGKLDASLSMGEWMVLSTQELVPVQSAANLWEGEMGDVAMGDATGAPLAISELVGRATDAREAISARPMAPNESEERFRVVTALNQLIAGGQRQLDLLSIGDLEGVMDEAQNMRLSLGLLRTAPMPQEM